MCTHKGLRRRREPAGRLALQVPAADGHAEGGNNEIDNYNDNNDNTNENDNHDNNDNNANDTNND